MRLTIRLFAGCRERAGTDLLEVEIAGNSASLEEVREAIRNHTPALAPLLGQIRIAVNETFAEEEDRVSEGDEIALIPPVGGGSALFALRDTPIGIAEVEDSVRSPGAGAVVSFLGTVRDETAGHQVMRLEYEAYDSMAVKKLRGIGDEIKERWPETTAAILHRVGTLDVGEAAVAIACASPHRADAFAACRHAIERIKKDVPIWKKEIRKDGSIWVGEGS